MANDHLIRQSLHESLVAPVREMILSGELKAGEKVPEEQLCERFGVSRTPIREALKVLAAEGVLQILPHRGAIVARITETEVEELFPVMASLERLAGQLACQMAGEHDLRRVRILHDEMMEAYAQGRELDYLRLNREVHDSIFAIAGNQTLHTFYNQVLTRIHSCRFVMRKNAEDWSRAVQEHEQIIAALEARNGEALGALLERHVTGTTVSIARDFIRRKQAEDSASAAAPSRRGRRPVPKEPVSPEDGLDPTGATG